MKKELADASASCGVEHAVAKILNHRNVGSVVDVDANCGSWMTMELMKYGNLREVASNCGGLSEVAARFFLKDALQALAHFHEPKHTDVFGRKNMILVHHDVKPENMLVTEDDNGKLVLKLGDFGLSRFTHVAPSSTQFSAGTKAFLPPEAKTETSFYTPAADIFSWAKSFGMVMNPQKGEASLPLKALLAKCLDENHEGRPTAQALLKDPYFSNDDTLFSSLGLPPQTIKLMAIYNPQPAPPQAHHCRSPTSSSKIRQGSRPPMPIIPAPPLPASVTADSQQEWTSNVGASVSATTTAQDPSAPPAPMPPAVSLLDIGSKEWSFGTRSSVTF